jgi:hypothetical protein
MLVLTTLDLAIGVIDYRKHLGVQTAWIHHSVYIVLLIYLLCTRMTFTLMVRFDLISSQSTVGWVNCSDFACYCTAGNMYHAGVH